MFANIASYDNFAYLSRLCSTMRKHALLTPQTCTTRLCAHLLQTLPRVFPPQINRQRRYVCIVTKCAITFAVVATKNILQDLSCPCKIVWFLLNRNYTPTVLGRKNVCARVWRPYFEAAQVWLSLIWGPAKIWIALARKKCHPKNFTVQIYA